MARLRLVKDKLNDFDKKARESATKIKDNDKK